jgi:hypothetical protein
MHFSNVPIRWSTATTSSSVGAAVDEVMQRRIDEDRPTGRPKVIRSRCGDRRYQAVNDDLNNLVQAVGLKVAA